LLASGEHMKRNRMGLLRVGDDGSTWYQAPNGTRYRLGKGEPVGRIHSIEIGPIVKVNMRNFTTTHTKMRCRVRNNRPTKMRARRRGTGSTVSTGSAGGTGNLSLSEDFVAKLVIHIVRPHLDDDVTYKGKGRTVSEDSYKGKGRTVSEDSMKEDVFVDQESSPMLKPRKIRPPSQGEGPKQKLSEFEEIMRKRKNKVDTMDNTGRLMKSLSHSSISEKHHRSPLWNIVRECLKDKSYYNFASKRMGSFSHTP